MEEKTYTASEIDVTYFMGVFNSGGIEALSTELNRLKNLDVTPHEIVDNVKQYIPVKK